MVPQTFSYLGELRCEATHGPSRMKLITDAPADNHGRGQAFSPTDLAVTSLATCMMTTMAIAVEPEGMKLAGSTMYAEKHMSTDPPRRIVKVVVRIRFAAGIAKNHRSRLEHIARTCPVARSLHPDIVIDLSFEYPD
jgi:putative redox protein